MKNQVQVEVLAKIITAIHQEIEILQMPRYLTKDDNNEAKIELLRQYADSFIKDLHELI